jgi:hypothetical protein
VGYVIFVVEGGIEHRRKDGIDREGAEVAKERKGRGSFGFSDFRIFGGGPIGKLCVSAALREAFFPLTVDGVSPGGLRGMGFMGGIFSQETGFLRAHGSSWATGVRCG